MLADTVFNYRSVNTDHSVLPKSYHFGKVRVLYISDECVARPLQ